MPGPSLLWRRTALRIIHVPGNRPRLQFNWLMREPDGISPKAFTDTLAVLHEQGVVGRAFLEIPPRIEFFPTDDGKELWVVILSRSPNRR